MNGEPIKIVPNNDLFEPITYENFSELRPGDWIWDSAIVQRRTHQRCINPPIIEEPYGFRLINIIDPEPYGLHEYSIVWMLSNVDGHRGGYDWERFNTGRYYRLKNPKHAHWVVTKNECAITCSECGYRLELCYPDGAEVRYLGHCPRCGLYMVPPGVETNG